MFVKIYESVFEEAKVVETFGCDDLTVDVVFFAWIRDLEAYLLGMAWDFMGFFPEGEGLGVFDCDEIAAFYADS